jgi:magnesium chelatase family protein
VELTTATFVPPTLALARVTAGTLFGLSLRLVEVEVGSRRGPAHFQLAGLAEAAVREARIRVSSAISQLGLTLEEYAITVSLAPADVRKSGSGLDLALAVAILEALGHLPSGCTRGSLVLGELGLDGTVRPIPGILPLLDGAEKCGLGSAFVPLDNAAEGARVRGIRVHPVRSLEELVRHLEGERPIFPLSPTPYTPRGTTGADLSEIRGQAASKRALSIAAAGRHHLLLLGPPGAGKSMLARRLVGLLPPLDLAAALETTALHSIAGLLDRSSGIVDTPPLRAPHHTVSDVGLVGGGGNPRPGEISLAHNGVLFLDELLEFRRSALEALRQPLEEKSVNIVRAQARAAFPARPLVVLAMNPCPCGHYGSPRGVCRCDPAQRTRYLAKLSGPLLDRIDLHMNVAPVEVGSLARGAADPNESTTSLASRVATARARQLERKARGLVGVSDNGEASLDDLKRIAPLDPGGTSLIESAFTHLGLSARSYVRILRVARTIADLEDSDRVREEHVGEAVCYRTLEFEHTRPFPPAMPTAPTAAAMATAPTEKVTRAHRLQSPNGDSSTKERKRK